MGLGSTTLSLQHFTITKVVGPTDLLVITRNRDGSVQFVHHNLFLFESRKFVSLKTPTNNGVTLDRIGLRWDFESEFSRGFKLRL